MEAVALGEEQPLFWEKRGEKRMLVWKRKWRHLQDQSLPGATFIVCRALG